MLLYRVVKSMSMFWFYLDHWNPWVLESTHLAPDVAVGRPQAIITECHSVLRWLDLAVSPWWNWCFPELSGMSLHFYFPLQNSAVCKA